MVTKFEYTKEVISSVDLRKVNITMVTKFEYTSGYIQTHYQKDKKIKRADQILPEVYGTTLRRL
jgi:hypothetical protein